MKVSIFDVAKKAGLSVVTVSRVLNNAQTVREKNRQKVLQAMKELDYHPNAAARSLAKGKTGVIGMIVTTLQDSFLDSIVQTVSSLLKDHGYYLALSVANYPQEEGVGRDFIEEDRVDGLLLLSPIHELSYLTELRNRNIPFVLIDHQTVQPDVHGVTVDNYTGGYEATRHLVELGHRSIAHIQGPGFFLSSIERERGFRQALDEAGLEPFAVEPGEFSIESGYQAVRQWLDQGQLPTALFAADDFTALGAINALTEAGLRVPEHMSIVGYDDQVLASELRPRLTTMRQPAEQIGKAAVDMLVKQMNGVSLTNRTVRLNSEIIVRESTAAPQSQ
ncbi:LacI family transcriptional regulator [Paenibacillus thiaminolyticus]|uniref:LacI family transcriptional regulator n=1 Tax=Paenibacillus thiaminolyticus TaxID=49283 RepID=A0AAP9J0I3_PANTH|nr:LacI family DNA-binding transcriptional regulator [Paenibacillus thiaminolyticus]MCY9535773.1 LacI family transcriptional regulator [Paenibacillus thiaminolyticus]MCY9601035.1 LacI family transcriptional regulator [Paenibacillus thiaminolyticus]MCY9609480.1 LacI family transcriptional regulator [Paenibacillus thiaminolyticus]MCY9613246.1 LacI family transcriptional regulator [Paenibacillus thiaminolyticus]MCY9617661.1 LacI family transcriptional regulator [Paenibacillus thiaminolyticus]